MALKTPLMSSVTNRGKETAFRMLRVVPATRFAASPKPWVVANGAAGASSRRSLAKAPFSRSAESAPATCSSLCISSRTIEAAAWQTLTIAAAICFFCSSSSSRKAGLDKSSERTVCRTSGRGSRTTSGCPAGGTDVEFVAASFIIKASKLRGEGLLSHRQCRLQPGRRGGDDVVFGGKVNRSARAQLRQMFSQPGQHRHA